MKTLSIVLLFTVTGVLYAQDTITLEDCHRLAAENAPRLADRENIRQIGDLKTDEAKSGWYPVMDLNGKLSYQSDVVTVALTDATIPVSFPEVPHDQYGLNLDIRQTLFDGGMSRQKRRYEQARTAADLQEVEVDLYGLKSRVNQYYFAILVLQENLRNLEIHMETLTARLETVKTAVEEGILLETELRVIEVEMLRIQQSVIDAGTRKKSFLDALNLLCGTSYPEVTVLILPGPAEYSREKVNRPEQRLFELKDASLEAGKQLISSKRMPVVYAFGQTGYGKPGYNMLSGEWDFYYMLGAGLTWNIWDWNSTGRDKEVIVRQQQMLQNQREAFDREIESLMVMEEAKIERYRESMVLEEQVLEMRTEISRNAATQLANGTITATDYITELNKESLARISLATQGILLCQSITNYLTIQGNL